MTQDRLEELMVKVADTTASPSEHEELMAYLVEHPDLRRELEAHCALNAVTAGWVQRLDADLAEDRFEKKPTPRLMQRLGLVLGLGGYLALLGHSIGQAMQNPETPTWVAWSMGLCLTGFLLFLASAIHWRLTTHANDPYKEVVR